MAHLMRANYDSPDASQFSLMSGAAATITARGNYLWLIRRVVGSVPFRVVPPS